MTTYMNELNFTKEKVLAPSQLFFCGADKEKAEEIREKLMNSDVFEYEIESALAKSFSEWRMNMWEEIDKITSKYIEYITNTPT